MRARIAGVKALMNLLDFLFGVQLGRKVLNMVDNLSRALQATSTSACGGQRLVSLIVITI